MKAVCESRFLRNASGPSRQDSQRRTNAEWPRAIAEGVLRTAEEWLARPQATRRTNIDSVPKVQRRAAAS